MQNFFGRFVSREILVANLRKSFIYTHTHSRITDRDGRLGWATGDFLH